MDYIVYSDNRFVIKRKGQLFESDCKMIQHYKNASEQLRRSHEWKSGTEPVFGDSFLIPLGDMYFEPKVNGVASLSGDYFYYSVELEKGGGIYKKSKTDPNNEGFIFTSGDIVPQHIAVNGNRLACSLLYPDGTANIAMFISERTDYYELTCGDSVDENPFIHNGEIYFNSAGIRRNTDGGIVLSNRGVSKYDIQTNSIIRLLYSEKEEFILPKVTSDGDLYFIRRPVDSTASFADLFMGIITAPFWLVVALLGFLSAFIRIFSGKQLMNKTNKEAAKASAKEIVDGCEIDVEREKKRSYRKDGTEAGYAPRSWELIRIKNGAILSSEEEAITALKNAEIIHRGVIGYELTDDGGCIISNGSSVIRLKNKDKELILKSDRINRNFTVINV